MSSTDPVLVIIVTHGDAGQAMILAAEKLVGPLPGMLAVRSDQGEPSDALAERIDAAVHALGDGREVLFLVDLYGSTPARLCCKRCAGHSTVVTGLNLAMLLKLATADRSGTSLELAQLLCATGTKSIQVIAS